MTQGPTANLRSLTAQEEIYWLLNWNSPIHPVLAAHVTGHTVPEQWRDALDQLQQRHPFLSVSIEAPEKGVTGSRPYFKQHRGVSIPLRVVQWDAVPRWEAEIERELAVPFAPGEAPLLRAVLIHGTERSILILAGCHSIADGTTFTLLFRDILTAVAGRALEALPFPRSAEEALGLVPIGPDQSVEDDLNTAPENDAGEPKVSSLQLPQSLTLAVAAASREQGTTVQGALAAAVVVAVRQQAPEFLDRPTRFISPVNTREVLGVGEDCGMYFTSPQAAIDPKQNMSFWDIARSVRRGIVEASTHEALMSVTVAMRETIVAGLTRKGSAEMLHGAFAEDVLLSNLGRTPFESTFGNLHLESLWGPAVLAGLPEMQTIGVATTNDSMCLLLTSFKPIPQLLEAVRAVLSDL